LQLVADSLLHCAKRNKIPLGAEKKGASNPFCSARLMRVFYRTPTGYTAERKTENATRRKVEKEEYGIVFKLPNEFASL
jgi:hypothetical protein